MVFPILPRYARFQALALDGQWDECWRLAAVPWPRKLDTW